MVTSVQTVLTCSKLVSPQAMSQIIKYLYTGVIDTQIINMAAIKQVSHGYFIILLMIKLFTIIFQHLFVQECKIR